MCTMNPLLRAWGLAACGVFPAVLAGDVRGDALDAWQWRLPVPQGNDLSSIAFGNGIYVAVGGPAALLVSTNGIDWLSRGLEWPVRLSSVTFGNGRFVAVGDDQLDPGNRDVLVGSTNGFDWVDLSLHSNQVLRLVTFGNGLFLTFGYDTPSSTQTRLLASTNGVEWTDRSGLIPPYPEGGTDPK